MANWQVFFKRPGKKSIHFQEAITREHVAHLLEKYGDICRQFGLGEVEMNLDDIHEEFKKLFAKDDFNKLFQTEVGQGYLIGAWETAMAGQHEEGDFDEYEV